MFIYAQGGAAGHAIVGSRRGSGVNHVGVRGGDSGTGTVGNDAPRFTSAMPVAAALPGQPAAPMPSTVVPAGYQTPAGSDASLPPAVNVAGPITTTEAPAPSDPFRSIPDRLRQLGATYYLLESWGSEPQMYRFYCKMAMGGNADYTRYFEAADADPLQAMVQVLQQVETWRGGSRNEEVGTRN